ncbi:EAL domain-containing protein [Paenibacillus sp. N4]|uniref:EAL domain-containing protein n=1 Tax=Paenibacillus vietnamensis TaxID=2590547 RepID=UPI001CD14D9C|nr:EAL domain-containing protein [Paenibacillus vietnamensis]MCA0754826.1 EAL domain-containing protein [Paenibacillus vietnamensis]
MERNETDLRRLQAAVPQNSIGKIGSGHLGMIYLSWNFADWPRSERTGRLQETWRSFAEREAKSFWGTSLLYEGIQWMKDDLYVRMSLPSGSRDCLEGWLLELAYRQKEELEQRFVGMLRPEDRAVLHGRLHAGVAVVAAEPPGSAGVKWYAAMKKALLNGGSACAMERGLKRRAIDRLLERRLIAPVYQPIVSLCGEGEVFGYEALARIQEKEWFPGPMELFMFAREEGLTYSLDRLAREKAIEGCAKLRPNQKLFINVMAQIMEDPGFSPGQTLSLLEQYHLSPHHIVFEITERSSIEDFDIVKKALEHYRSQGYQIAIDDVGAGYSSLQSVALLRPDYIKVDRSIIQNIHSDELKEHILLTLLQLADKMGISVIAEGIEQEEELEKVRELGVHYAQGYLLGKPAPFLS